MEKSWEGLLKDGVALCWCPGLPGGEHRVSSPLPWSFKWLPPLHCSLPKAEPAGGTVRRG